MLCRHIARFIAIFLGVVTFVACGNHSPLTPSKAADRIGGQTVASTSIDAAQPITGSYQLAFLNTSLQPVSSLPVMTAELILRAHVADSSGLPAQRGVVTFQYCSYKGLPPNDITRADEAPSSACADGSATWKNLVSVQVDQSGNAYMDFGVVQIPRTVGFRFRYSSQGSGIANGVSDPADFTWVAS
jgi:hypothetical protein